MSHKILVLTPDLNVPGGVSNYYEALNLNSVSGVQYFFVSNNKKESVFNFIWRLLKNYILFINILSKGEIDIVHINPSLNFKSFFRDAFFLSLAQFYDKKTLVFFHGWSDAFEKKIKNSRFLHWVFLKTFAKCPNIIVLSNLFRNKLIDLGINPSYTKFWIESTVADTTFLDGFSIEDKLIDYQQGTKIKILFLSRIEEEKGIFIALDAFDMVQKEFNDKKFEFIIAGDGDALPDVKDYVTNHNIPNVTFTGYIKGNKKKKVLHDAHLFLFPTYYGEGMPTNILEAMLYGMPIISRYNAGIADAVDHGDNGLLTESKDAFEFANMLKEMLANDHQFAKIMKINHEKALENYASERVRDRIFNIYESIINVKHSYS